MSATPVASERPRQRGRVIALGALAALLMLLLAAGGLVGWMWHSESGTRWALQRVPGLQVEGAQGRLLGGPFQATRLQWQGGGWRVVVERLSWRDSAWRWRPWQGAWVGVTLTDARARSIVATPLEPASPAQSPAREPPANLELAFELAAQGLEVDLLRIADLPPITRLSADLHLGAAQGTEHRLPRVALVLGDVAAQGQASFATRGEMAVQARLELAGNEGTLRPWQAQAALTGPLRRLAVEATLSVPPGARAAATAILAPFAPFPLAALNLRTEALNLSALDPALPETQLSGHAELRETQADSGAPWVFDVQVDNALPGPWDAARLPLRHARGLLRTRADEPKTFAFEALEAEFGGERQGGKIHGGGRWSDGTLTLDLRLDGLQPARLDTRAPALLLSGPLTLTVRGLPAPGAAALPPGLAGELRITLEGGQLQRRAPRATLSADAVFALPGDGSAQFTLNTLRVTSGGATASASAEGGRSADGAWKLATRGELARFDPGTWWPAAAARGNALNGRWQADLRGSTVAAASPWDTLRGKATFELAASRYAGVPLQGSATLHARDDALGLQAELQAAGNRLLADGNVGVAGRTPRWRLDIDAPALGALAPLAALARGAPWIPRAGRLQANAEAVGRWPALASRGTLHATGLQSQALHLARADASWSLGGAGLDAPLTVQLDATGLVQGQRRLDTLQVRADGTLRAHRATLVAASPLRPPEWTDTLAAGAASAGSVLRISLEGRWQPGAGRGGLWQGSFGELRAAPRDRPDSPWLAARDLQLALAVASDGGLRSAELAPGRVVLFGGDVRWRQAMWLSAAHGVAAGYRIDAEVEPLQVAPLLARLQPAFAWQGDLAVGARVQIAAGTTFDADVVVTRKGGDLSLAYQGVRRVLGLNELQLTLAAHGGRWQLTHALVARNVGVLGGGLTVQAAPGAHWPAAAAPIEGGLSLRIDDLGVWAPWLPAGWQLGGQLQAVATVAGTAGNPQASGRINGSDLVLRNLFQGVHLRRGELAVTLRGREAVIERLVFHGGGEGTLSVRGRASLADTVPRAELHIAADRFGALDRVDRRIVMSGSADLALQGKRIRLGGRFEVDEGLIDFSQADAPRNDPDVIVVNRPGARTTPKGQPGLLAQAEVQLAVDLGTNLRLRGGGLDTLLRGQLHVTTRPTGELHVAGVIRTVEGTYAAYGQKLAIERGELTFTGDVANPRLDVIAVRPDMDTQRVGVVVTGNAVTPRVRLYSAPVLSEFEALAWLVLGREPGGLGRDDTAVLQRAALALLAGDRGGGGQDLVQRLGLDQLSFSAGASGNLNEGIVSLGKQISKRLYVGYEHALAAAGGTWQLVYRVAGRFTVRLQAGEDQTLDAIWTWRWE